MPEAASRWLMLVHQLPPKPSNLRVRIWRRLQQLGAVVLRNSVYVLPNTAEAREDFAWLRAEISAARGQVSVLEANAIDGYTNDELVEQFRSACDQQYRRLRIDSQAVLKRWAKAQRPVRRGTLQQELKAMRERLDRTEATDFFQAPGREEARQAVDTLVAFAQPSADVSPPAPVLKSADFTGRTWITRPRPGIDRIACAWLIRRFIDPSATFVFGTPAGSPSSAISFDMPDVEFGHHGTDCTYETLLKRFAIRDRAAQRIGQIVHDLDLKETRYGLPECAALARIIEGLRLSTGDDHQVLQHGMAMIEALYRSYTQKTSTRDVASPRRSSGPKSGRSRI
jgi:hypothetical protein